MRRWFSLALIAAIVLASCASEPPDVDWCYTYNLAVSLPEGITITSGEWLPGIGLATDETGELIVSFSEAFFIEPQYFTLWAIRLDDPGDIGIAANVSVFGLDALISETMPGIANEVQKTIERDPDDPVAAGTTVTATMQTTGGLAISQLDLGGYGATPYSANPCGEPTPTPEPSETPDITNTPEPTSTPTMSLTPSPTSTPDFSCSVMYDFTASTGGWTSHRFPGQTNSSTFGVHSPGSGWQGEFKSTNIANTTYIGAVSIQQTDFPQNMTVKQLHVTLTKTAGNQAQSYVVHEIRQNVSTVWGSTQAGTIVTGTETTTNPGSGWSVLAGDDIWIISTYHFDNTSPYNNSGSITLHSAQFVGTCSTPQPTPTNPPTNTLTPTVTRTPTLTRTPIVIGGGTGTPSRTPTRTALAVATWTPGPTNTPFPTMENTLPPPTYVTATPETYTPVFTYTPLPTGTDGAPGGTPWTTPTVGMGTPWGTPDGWGEAGVNGDDIIPWLQTAAAEVNTLPGSLDPYVPDPDTTEFLGYAKWMISCVSLQELLGTTLSVPACHVIAGLTLMFVVSSAFFSIRIARAALGIAQFLFGLMVAAVNMILTVVTGLLGMSPLVAIAVAVGVAASVFLASQIDEVEQIVSDVVEIISLIVQIVVGLFVTVISWMFFAVGLVVSIIQSFFTSTPLAVPGFPQCVTNPTGHDICAAWYMLDNTLLGGSVGALIVLIMIVIVDVTVVLWLARKVLAIVNSAERITSSGAA